VARPRIGELLVEGKVISQAQLDEALAAPRAEGVKIGQHLVELGVVTEAQLTQTLSLQLAIPWVSLYHIDFSRQLLNLVPRQIAEKFCAVPIFLRTEKKKPTTLYVAMDDPTNEQALVEIATAAGVPVKPMIASPSDIRSAIRVYYADLSDGPPPTTREPSAASVSVPIAAPVPSAPSPPSPPPASPPANPPRTPLPPSVPVATGAPAVPPRPPPMTGRAPLATVVDSIELLTTEPIAAPASAANAPTATRDSPDSDPEIEVGEYIPKPRQASGPRMVALTLLDGTTLNLPARPSPVPKRPGSMPNIAGALPDQLTARDLVSALRAASHGADASEILGEIDWQAMFAALLSVLLKKNLIADWEFVEELRNV
jgi:type IV pilus assembly protein PilB